MVYKEWEIIMKAIWTYKVSLEVTQVKNIQGWILWGTRASLMISTLKRACENTLGVFTSVTGTKMPIPSVSKATSSGEDSFFSLQVNFTTSACLSPYRWVFVLVLTGSYNRIFQTRKMRNCVVASRNFTVPADLLSSEDLFLNKMTPPHTHTLMRAELLWMNCFLKPLPLSNGFPIPTGGMF